MKQTDKITTICTTCMSFQPYLNVSIIFEVNPKHWVLYCDFDQAAPMTEINIRTHHHRRRRRSHRLTSVSPTLLNKPDTADILIARVEWLLPNSNKRRKPPVNGTSIFEIFHLVSISDAFNFEVSPLVTNRQLFIHGKFEAVLLLAKKLSLFNL